MTTRFRLRHMRHDYELPEGEFMIGRGSKCQLSVDDPLISRYHAKLYVMADSVTIEDLGSRNGTLVNGERVEGTLSVRAGDCIFVGAQELTLAEGMDVQRATLRLTAPVLRSTPPAPPIADLSPGEAAVVDTSAPTGVADRGNAFALFGGAADKAIALGRPDHAERLLARAIGEIQLACRAGEPQPAELVDEAMRYCAKLATATGKGQWVDVVVDVYDLLARPCHGTVVDELFAAMHKVDAIDLARFRGYIARLQAKQATFGPAERFLLRRLAGLEPLAKLR